MQIKNLIKYGSVMLGTAFVIQIFTFYLLSGKQLKNKLLPDHFQPPNHSYDSAYVRNYPGPMEDPPIPAILSHELTSEENKLKEKLRVDFIYFEEKHGGFNLNQSDFKVVYSTWYQQWEWITLSDFFKMTQIEELKIDKERIYERQVTYQWFIFFWIKRFEIIHNGQTSS